jgi:hypothetical protein
VLAWITRTCFGWDIRRHAAIVSLISDHGIHQMLRGQKGLTELLMDSGEVVAVGNLQTVRNTRCMGAGPTHLHDRLIDAVASFESLPADFKTGSE